MNYLRSALIIALFHLLWLQDFQSQTIDWVSLSKEVNGWTYALQEYDGKLVAAGRFTMAGDVPVDRIASWNGLDWEPMGSGVRGPGLNPWIGEMLEFQGDLFITGNFDSAGTYLSRDIAKWNGESWSSMGSGSNGIVYSIAEYNNELYVGGTFDSISGVAANKVAKWNGISWQSVGNGIESNNVNDLIVYEGDLYGVGVISGAGGMECNNLIRWDGVSWQCVAQGLEQSNRRFIEWESNLLIGTEHDVDWNGITVFIHQWDGNELTLFTDLAPHSVWDFHIHNGELYSCGGSGPGSPDLTLVKKWNGSGWVSVGTGINYNPQDMITFNEELYICGKFNHDDDSPHNYIAKYSYISNIEEPVQELILSYPNPTNSRLFIDLTEPQAPISISIYNSEGRRIRPVYEVRHDQVIINVESLSPGLYSVLLAYPDNKLEQGKVVVE